MVSVVAVFLFSSTHTRLHKCTHTHTLLQGQRSSWRLSLVKLHTRCQQISVDCKQNHTFLLSSRRANALTASNSPWSNYAPDGLQSSVSGLHTNVSGSAMPSTLTPLAAPPCAPSTPPQSIHNWNARYPHISTETAKGLQAQVSKKSAFPWFKSHMGMHPAHTHAQTHTRTHIHTRVITHTHTHT